MLCYVILCVLYNNIISLYHSNNIKTNDIVMEKKRTVRCTKAFAMRGVQGRAAPPQGLLYATLPCISARGCFQGLNS